MLADKESGRPYGRASSPSRCRLCHPGKVTSPRPVRSTGRVPVLHDEWREPLRAQRDPLAASAGRARADRQRQRQWRKQTWLGRFVSTYGWRAYVLPVLVALTVVVIYQTVTGTSTVKPAASEAIQGPPAIGVVGTSILDAPPRGLAAFDDNLPAGTLPDGGPFTEAGNKTWHVVPGTTPQVGQGTAKVFRYTVEVEDGLDPTMFGGDNAFAQMVDQTLANPKGWTHNPQFAFIRIDNGKPDFRISLVSPVTVREGCGYEFRLEDVLLQPGIRGGPASPGFHQRGALGAWRGPVRGRCRFLPPICGQPRGRPRHWLRASRAVRQAGRPGPGHDAADLLDIQ